MEVGEIEGKRRLSGGQASFSKACRSIVCFCQLVSFWLKKKKTSLKWNTPTSFLFIPPVSVGAGSKGAEVFMHRESSKSSQSYAQTVSYTGSSHGKLPLSVFSLWERRQVAFHVQWCWWMQWLSTQGDCSAICWFFEIVDKTFVSSFNKMHSSHYSLNNKHLICGQKLHIKHKMKELWDSLSLK